MSARYRVEMTRAFGILIRPVPSAIARPSKASRAKSGHGSSARAGRLVCSAPQGAVAARPIIHIARRVMPLIEGTPSSSFVTD